MRRVAKVGKSRKNAGFSLVEAMVAAAILGVALLGLVQLHKSSLRGTVRSQNVGQAAEVARQLAETTASQPFNQLPNCPPGATVRLSQPPGGVPPGCRASWGPGTTPSPVKGNGCTFYSDGANVPPVDPAAGDASVVAGSQRYRVDTTVSRHPNATLPNTAVVNVYVCWNEPTGEIREITSSRLVTVGL